MKMFENIKKNKISTLEPKKEFVNKDINIEDYDLLSIFTIIAVMTIFLLSLKLFLISAF